MDIAYLSYASPIGELTLACAGDSLVGLYFGHKAPCGGGSRALEAAARWLDGYFAGRDEPVPIMLRPEGGAYARRVWERVTAIPYGRTETYGALARELGTSPRALGGAVGRNPIPIFVPCHRVVGAGGALTGYVGGLEAKRFLLAHEAEAARYSSRQSPPSAISPAALSPTYL